MKFNFRHGIQHAPQVGDNLSFLTYNPGNNTITISIGVDFVRATAAYGDYNYLIEEREITVNAWGPFIWNPLWNIEPVGSYTLHLYWDISRSTGLISRGFTPMSPLFGSIPPLSPSNDQHWFDTNTNTMYVWDGIRWKSVIRVFAGSFVNGTQTITEKELGSQVDITVDSLDQVGWYEHGYILYGADQKAIRYNDANFVTTASRVLTHHGSFASPIRLELLNSTFLAIEPLPAFYVISNTGAGTIQLASGTDIEKRPIGIILVPANPGDPVDIITQGIVYNEQWNWDELDGKDLYCGETGELTQEALGPFVIGTILDPQSVLINIVGAGPAGPPGQPTTLAINNYTDSIILGLSDINAMVRMNSSSPNIVTIPPISSESFQIGDTTIISQIGSGLTSIEAGVGVIINAPLSLSLGMRYGKITATMVAINEWDVEGNLLP